MNFGQASKTEIALILYGLRAIYVDDQEKLRQKLIEQAEGALAKHGYVLPEV